jgi:hypothetical protein
MSIVKVEQFNLPPFNIPNLEDMIDEAFNAFANKHEQDILSDLLGFDLLTAFNENCPEDYSDAIEYADGAKVARGVDVYVSQADENVGNNLDDENWWLLDEINNRFLLLKKGFVFKKEKKKIQWKGLVELLPPYLFNRWYSANYSDNTEMGIVVASNELGENSNPGVKLSEAWNTFVDHSCDLYKFLSLEGARYVEDIDEDFDSFDEYLQTYFQHQEKINEFGL